MKCKDHGKAYYYRGPDGLGENDSGAGTDCPGIPADRDLYDPAAFYLAHASEDPGYMAGIRMVTKLAKDFRYFNTFNSNNVILHL